MSIITRNERSFELKKQFFLSSQYLFFRSHGPHKQCCQKTEIRMSKFVRVSVGGLYIG